MTTTGTFAVITGGGTAGHVLPALAVAEALEERGHDAATLHYVGTERGIERELLPPTPYPYTLFDVVGVQRRVDRRNLDFAPKLYRATRRAGVLLGRLQPRVVVSVGGYGSLPSVLAARRARIPVVVVSFDRRPGRASAVAARFAAACAVAYPGSALPRAEVTGAPVRRSIRAVDRATGRDDARVALGLPTDRFVVAVMGGSLGSGVLNEAVRGYVADRRDDNGLAVRHAVGARYAGDGPPVGWDDPDAVLYQPIGFEPRMDLLYAAADVLVGRGGAATVAEVAVTGTPAVLVPWSGAAEDHQTANVAWLADQDAAIALAESDIDRLGPVLDGLRADVVRRQALGDRARAAGAVHRSDRIPHMIERVALASNAS